MQPDEMIRELLIALQTELPDDLKDAPFEEKWLYLMGWIAAGRQMLAASRGF